MTESPAIIDVATPHGTARVHVRGRPGARATLVLGHGAGGGVGAPDLVAATRAGVTMGTTVALVEQPYRVAGRRSPAPSGQLDAAWLAVIGALRERGLVSESLIVGGRSSGARVACRTAAQAGAAAVLCLAFPLHPPGRAGDPSGSRLPELEAAGVPTLVVQGERDPFGIPPRGPDRVVTCVPGNHSLRNTAAVQASISEWLSMVLVKERSSP